MAWAVAVASDIGFNKYLLGLSPKPEFRRGMHTPSTRSASGRCWRRAVGVSTFFGGLGAALQPYSPLVAIVTALVMPPILAAATKANYLRRTHDGIDLPMYDEHGNPSAARC